MRFEVEFGLVFADYSIKKEIPVNYLLKCIDSVNI